MTNSAHHQIGDSANGANGSEGLRQLREQLAELEHEQWCNWSRSVAESEMIAPERLEAWKRRWVPYSEFSEADKDMDREYADRVLDLLVAKPGARQAGDAS